VGYSSLFTGLQFTVQWVTFSFQWVTVHCSVGYILFSVGRVILKRKRNIEMILNVLRNKLASHLTKHQRESAF